jgi:hypothetical protein
LVFVLLLVLGDFYRFDQILDRFVERVTVDLGALLQIFDRQVPGLAVILMGQQTSTSQAHSDFPSAELLAWARGFTGDSL